MERRARERIQGWEVCKYNESQESRLEGRPSIAESGEGGEENSGTEKRREKKG